MEMGIIGATCLCHEVKLFDKEDQIDCQALQRILRWIVRSEAGILEMEKFVENFMESDKFTHCRLRQHDWEPIKRYCLRNQRNLLTKFFRRK